MMDDYRAALNKMGVSTARLSEEDVMGTLLRNLQDHRLSGDTLAEVEPLLSKWALHTLLAHPNCPTSVFYKHAYHHDWWIRSCILSNPNAPKEILSLSVALNDSYCCMCLANNPNTPRQTIIEILVEGNYRGWGHPSLDWISEDLWMPLEAWGVYTRGIA